jgi:hypothetical protein
VDSRRSGNRPGTDLPVLPLISISCRQKRHQTINASQPADWHFSLVHKSCGAGEVEAPRKRIPSERRALGVIGNE